MEATPNKTNEKTPKVSDVVARHNTQLDAHRLRRR